jgi:very-short-patch-repair endonuclease
MHMPRNRNLILNAKELRLSATKEEKHLWYDYLSRYPVRFTRQKIIGNYIADFYCDAAKLVIELDGSQHYTPEGVEYDRIREEYINSLGIEVVRFTNIDVRDRFEGVCNMIDRKVKERT